MQNEAQSRATENSEEECIGGEQHESISQVSHERRQDDQLDSASTYTGLQGKVTRFQVGVDEIPSIIQTSGIQELTAARSSSPLARLQKSFNQPRVTGSTVGFTGDFQKEEVLRANSDSLPDIVARRSPDSSSIALTSGKEAAAYVDYHGHILYPLPSDSEMNLSGTDRSGHKSRSSSRGGARSRVLQLRKRVQDLRHQVQDQRSRLQDQDGRKAEADEEYIKLIRTTHVTSEGLSDMDRERRKELEVLWNRCQEARNYHGVLEDDLRKMEDRLETEEARLERAEMRLYDQEEQEPAHPGLAAPQEDSESSSDSSSDGSEEGSLGLYDEYQFMLGKQDLLHERIAKLQQERMRLKEEEERRKPYSIPLDTTDLRFLQNFDDTIGPYQAELVEVSDVVEQLRKECREGGLIDEAGSQIGGRKDNVDTKPDRRSQGISQKSTSLMDAKNPDNNDVSISFESDDPGAFEVLDPVNEWLLRILRSSYYEVFLARVQIGNIDYLDKEAWQSLALELWHHDGTALLERKQRSSMMGNPDTVRRNVEPDGRFSGGYFSLTVGSDSSIEDDKFARVLVFQSGSGTTHSSTASGFAMK